MVSQGGFDREFAEAVQAGKAFEASHPRAVRASLDEANQRLVVSLSNGTQFGIPTHLIEGLNVAHPKGIAQIEISPSGEGLHWPQLDLDLSVTELIAGAYGTHAWMRALAAMAGGRTSEAKAAAARINGRKGGRPASDRQVRFATASRKAVAKAGKKAKAASKKSAAKRAGPPRLTRK